MKAKRSVRIVLCIAFSLLFFVSLGMLLREGFEAHREQEKFDSLIEKVKVVSAPAPAVSEDSQPEVSQPETSQAESSADGGESLMPRYETLYSENPDFGGWIRIDGTEINYPVMFTPENPEKYLHLNFDGETSSFGVPFFGAGSSLQPRSDNLILYGHNMKNGKMFAGLVKYSNQAYLQKHPEIYFSTLYEEGNYQIISAFPTDVDGAKALRCYDFINARDKSDFDAFISGIKAASLYDTGATAEYGDKLLTLSTCAYHTNDGRFVVVAKKKAG